MLYYKKNREVTQMKKPITDHLGNHYESIKKMCEMYGINEKTYHSRVNRDNYTLEEALGVMPRIGKHAKAIKIDDKLTIISHICEDYYHCFLDDKETILIHSDIVKYFHKNIF